MTEQEAIKALKFDMEMILFDPYEGKKRTLEEVKNINEANYLCYLADEVAIQALEKQIPKKTVTNNIPKTAWTKATTKYTCPSCDRVIGFNELNYCPTCGQRLSWE